ncbi:hypothetical protein CXB51_016166 [Gossypium anomalum]|uniref:Transmembrane 9 superfamily member n=1 Tax=Gossypium anomalum TaxID=47600 RepID=A0A8J5YYD9_9ROSI|nr:hypothetical protein CXB51_016166 [Gossypium anomalum]
MRKDEACKVACRVKLDAEAAKNFKKKIDGNYRVNMILGNVSVTERQVEGFPIGFKGSYYPRGKAVYFINNHLSFKVMYHVNPEDDSAQIVGFHVYTYRCPSTSFFLDSFVLMCNGSHLEISR